jgi:hypothetical protein
MRIAVALYAFALLVRLVLIGLFPDPAYVDSFIGASLLATAAFGLVSSRSSSPVWSC